MHRLDRLALLLHDNLTQGSGKVGLGILRYSEAEIVAVVDRQHAGGDLPALTGIPRPVPIVATVEEAARLGAETLIPGITSPGGSYSSEWREEIKAGLAAGLSLVNVMHPRLEADPELRALLHPGRFIWDVRAEPEGVPVGMGRAAALPARRVLTVGTDMRIGKMTAAIELDRAARRRGLRSKFLASGQTGICIAGDGVAVDGVRVDFATGAVEALVAKYGYDYDLLCIEGQGSILHPGSSAWLALLRGSSPTHLILCHRAGQETIRKLPGVRIPSLREVAALYEAVSVAGGALPGAKVVGIALHCPEGDDAAAQRTLEVVETETGLPATDVVRFGAERLLGDWAV